MAMHAQTDSLVEDARRGQEAFDRCVRPNLRQEDDGKFVAVDISSGEYEIDSDDYEATGRLMARLPGSRLWLFRAGHATTYRIGRAAIGGES